MIVFVSIADEAETGRCWEQQLDAEGVEDRDNNAGSILSAVPQNVLKQKKRSADVEGHWRRESDRRRKQQLERFVGWHGVAEQRLARQFIIINRSYR